MKNEQQKIIPNLWFKRNAQAAVDFYLSAFSDGQVVSTFYYPKEGLADFQQEFAGKPVTIYFDLMGYRFAAINAGDEFTPNPAISFMVNFDPARDTQAEQRLKALWAKLTAQGKILMPLQAYDFSKLYGWVEDQYGVSWQLILTDPTGEPRPKIIPALLFVSNDCILTEAAVNEYCSIFQHSQKGITAYYPAGMPNYSEQSVMFTDFKLEDQWFAAMDGSSKDHTFTFNEGISFSIDCADQAEIDYFYSKLSHHPSSEVCGWCKDQYGVSWQVVPKEMETLMQQPDAWQKLMGMKKIVIAEFGKQ